MPAQVPQRQPDRPGKDPGYPVVRYIGLGICALLFGLPGLVFCTGGMILVPIAGLLLLVPFLLVHYLLWYPRNQKDVQPGSDHGAPTPPPDGTSRPS